LTVSEISKAMVGFQVCKKWVAVESQKCAKATFSEPLFQGLQIEERGLNSSASTDF